MPPTPTLRLGAVPFTALVALLVTGCGDSPTDPPPTGEVVVVSVTPDVLRPGEEAILEGHHFASVAEQNEVRIHGERVQVLEASSTSLRIRLPSFLCAPEGEAPIVVEVGDAESAPFLRAFEPTGVVEMAPGELRIAAWPDDLCLILGASGERAEYVVGTQSTSEVDELVTGVAVHGRVPGAPAATGGLVAGLRAPGSAGVGAQAVGHGEAPIAGDEPARWADHRRGEARLRMDERRLADRILRTPAPRGFASSTRVPRVPSTVQPGDTVNVNVPDVSEGANSCTQGEEIEGIVRRVGTNSIWIEDRANPSGGFTAEDFDLLSDEFDHEIFEEVVGYFGEPTDIDSNDRIVVIVSEQVNRMSTALAFVALADFFPGDCPGANGGEFYYARAPDPQGSITGPEGETRAYSRTEARRDAPRLLAHEVTHIVQFGRRLQLPNPDGAFQAVWLLEGQATFAEEVVGHRYTGLQPRQNLGRGVALGSNHPPTSLAWYQAPFFDLAVYYGFDAEDGAPQECTWLSVRDPEPCASGRIAYGVTWSFLRWATDHFHDAFGGGERELQRRIVSSPAQGFAVFEDVLGEDPTELLAYWAATLYTDGRVDGDPFLSFPSWDLRHIEAGLVSSAHLRPETASFANFREVVQVAAASSYYQLLASQSGHPPFAFAARTTADGTLPEFMQLWVARIR